MPAMLFLHTCRKHRARGALLQAQFQCHIQHEAPWVAKPPPAL